MNGGVQIEGLPVIGYFRAFLAKSEEMLPGEGSDGDVGWKPHRFRKYNERRTDEEIGDSSDLELVGAGTGR